MEPYGVALEELASLIARSRSTIALTGAGMSTDVQLVVTQNVDGLHQAAGSRAAFEAHGTLREVECLACGWRGPAATAHAQLDAGAPTPRCVECNAILKPAVVLFGEMLPAGFLAVPGRVESCDLLLCCGSSLGVPPVALLPARALRAGAAVAIVNLGPTSCDAGATLRIEGRTGEALPALLALLSG